MSDALLKNTFNKISPAYELVADATVGVATTQVDFSGLNFGKDDDLLLASSFAYNAGGSPHYLFVNGNTTTTNYYSQSLRADGTTIEGSRQNQPFLGYTSGSPLDKHFSNAKLKLANNGYFVYQSNSNQFFGGSSNKIEDTFGSSTFTISSITSLSIKSSIANGIGVGSRFQLYRLKAKKVADIIVGSATTQVDITGLSIDKDSEYMLVSETVANVNPCSYYLYVNGNTTDANYYVQRLLSASTTVQANRYNATILMNTGGGTEKDLSITNIKLTNSGYFVYQSNHTHRLTSVLNMELRKWYGTSTFTMTSITSLSIVASVANGIGIGSRFTLYKMR